MIAYFEEGGWVLADIAYKNAEERFIYFPRDSFDEIGNIPVMNSLESVSATAAERIIPVWGPGSRFNAAKDFAAEKGTDLKVFFRENGYVYAEYKSANGTVRMWLPDDYVEFGKAP